MKPSTFYAPLLATLLSGAASKYVHCESKSGGDYTTVYTISANDIPDVPGTCGGLWDNLKHFSSCLLISSPKCDPGEGYDGQKYDMIWHFGSTSICNEGMVESAWYEATKNQYGSINCGGD